MTTLTTAKETIVPIREGAPLGAPCWIDLSTSDVDRAKDFYGAVFGWTFEDAGPEYGGYVNAAKDGQPVAGLMYNDPQWHSPDGWTTYLHTADVTATLNAATSAGATTCVAPMEVKDKGHMAMLTDPTGAFVGLWQPIGHQGFNIVKEARQSNATAFLMNVYDLEPGRLGTFDLVLFYGVFYHLKHPQHALERIRSICTGTLLFQTHTWEEPAVKDTPSARFYPHGMLSGLQGEHYDATVFWLFNQACCTAMLDHVGFTELEVLSRDPHPFVMRARSPEVSPGAPPDQTEAPWC